MATQSTAPVISADANAAATAPAQPNNDDQQDAGADLTKQTTTSVFVNSEPMREEQVQNAVKFLSHPKVKGSPVIYRRSFLEKKGLTKEEIDEAFRRVPDAPPSTQTSSATQEGQVKSPSNIQPQASTQTLQPTAIAPSGIVSSVGALTRSRFHWSHAVLAVGFLAISGAGTAVIIKNAVVPRLKSWIRKVVLEEDDLVKKIDSRPSLAEEAAAAAIAAAAAATDVAKASQEMMHSKSEERQKFEQVVNLLDAQIREMKSMTNAIQRLEGQSNTPGRTFAVNQEDLRPSVTTSKQLYANGKADYDLQAVGSSSPPTSVEPSMALHPKSYMEIMAMVQRGEKPSNIREISDLPPNPNQQPSNPRAAPRVKPWEVEQFQSNSGSFVQSQVSGEGLNTTVQDNGVTYQMNGESSVPWWQRKNVRVTEVDNEDELKAGSNGGRTTEQSVNRAWVPPQPPPVALPEAAEAIRRPKPSVQKEQLANERSVTHADVTDELQRITKISESGGPVDNSGGNSGISLNEIEELQ